MNKWLFSVERTYMEALRVIVLLAATLAVLLFTLNVVRALPVIMQQLAGGEPRVKVEGATLGDYIAEKKSENTPASDAAPADPGLPQDIRDGIDMLKTYDTTRSSGGLDMAAVGTDIAAFYNQLPEANRLPYASSFKALMKQLSISTGTPLTTERLQQLMS